jgi:peptidoglycan/xylan/chitin deacetylase (PgdA/CDA1 family)
MKISKRIARKIMFPIMMGISMDKIIRTLSKNRILNITYHGVVENDGNYFSPRNLEKEQFEKQLIYFKKNFDIKSTSEIFEMVKQNKLPNRKTISISFDDGLKNNLFTVLPLLEKYQIPATFCISSICVEDMDIRCLWAEKIAALKYFYKDEKIILDDYIFENFIEKTSHISIENILKTIAHDKRDKILENIENRYNLNQKLQLLPEELWKLMTKDEVIQLSKSKLIEIGSHGHLHYNLGEVDIEKSEEELTKSKELLEKAIGRKINIIAYPDGSYTSEVKNLAEKVGYEYQLAVKYRLNEDKLDNRILNRHGISSGTTFDSNILFLNYSFFQTKR